MHEWNYLWWQKAKAMHPDLFRTKRVLEVGSYNINGSVREHFTLCDYTGVDWRPGPGVDVIALAHDMNFEQPFDVVVSAQMLEHDPYWKDSIRAMVLQLKPDGHLLLSWGPAHADVPHHPEAAPDGGYHPLPAGKVLKILTDRSLVIEWASYEADFALHPPTPGSEDVLASWDRGTPLPAYSDGTVRDNYFVVMAAMPGAGCKQKWVTELLPGDLA